MDIPLNPIFMAKADKLLELLNAELGEPRSCTRCGEIFFSPPQHQLDLLDRIIPNPDFKDLDLICATCMNREVDKK